MTRPVETRELMAIDPAAFWRWCRLAWTESPSLFERQLRSLDELALCDLIALQTEGAVALSGSSERLFSRFLEVHDGAG